MPLKHNLQYLKSNTDSFCKKWITSAWRCLATIINVNLWCIRCETLPDLRREHMCLVSTDQIYSYNTSAIICQNAYINYCRSHWIWNNQWQNFRACWPMFFPCGPEPTMGKQRGLPKISPKHTHGVSLQCLKIENVCTLLLTLCLESLGECWEIIHIESPRAPFTNMVM